MNDLKFYIYSIPFFIAFIVQLFACVTYNEKLRIQTKPLLMPLLILAVILYSFLGVKSFQLQKILLIGAIFLGWIGDLYLLKNPADSGFLKGARFFLIAHIFYIAILFIKFDFEYVRVSIATLIIFIYAVLLFVTLIKQDFPQKTSSIELWLYAIALSASSCIALILLITHFTATSTPELAMNKDVIMQIVIIFIGGIFFIISDATLSFATFTKHFKQSDSIIMGSYMIAQFLLALGISLC